MSAPMRRHHRQVRQPCVRVPTPAKSSAVSSSTDRRRSASGLIATAPARMGCYRACDRRQPFRALPSRHPRTFPRLGSLRQVPLQPAIQYPTVLKLLDPRYSQNTGAQRPTSRAFLQIYNLADARTGEISDPQRIRGEPGIPLPFCRARLRSHSHRCDGPKPGQGTKHRGFRYCIDVVHGGGWPPPSRAGDPVSDACRRIPGRRKSPSCLVITRLAWEKKADIRRAPVCCLLRPSPRT
jgi:hypothetical protein